MIELKHYRLRLLNDDDDDDGDAGRHEVDDGTLDSKSSNLGKTDRPGANVIKQYSGKLPR